MKKIAMLLFALAGACALFGAPDSAPDDRRLFTAHAGEKDIVYWVPQFSEFKEVSELDMLFLKKVLARAEKQGVKAVVFELDTPGGQVNVALQYLSLFAKSKVPVVAYLNPQGISAGMIIALGADRVAINSRGVIGDAMPLQMGPGGVRPVTVPPPKDVPVEKDAEKSPQMAEKKEEKPADTVKDEAGRRSEKADRDLLERLADELRRKPDKAPETGDDAESKRLRELADQKFLTVFFKILQVSAERNGRPVKVVRATSDPYVELTMAEDGIDHKQGSPLTLSAAEAKRLKVVDYIADSRNSVLDQIGLPDATVEVVKRSPTEEIISFLAHPLISGILLMLGLVGMFVEIKTPGFGVSGVLGIACLVLFFLGHVASGASEWGPMVIFFVGVLLLLLEIFVIPGFGLVGVLGFGCMVISFFAAFGFENVERAAQVVGLSLLAAVAAMVVLALYVLPKTPLFRRFVLQSSISSSEGFSAPEVPEEIIGKVGVALTPLRPSGTIEVDRKRYDAMTAGDFIAQGEDVVVESRSGFQLIVRKA